MGLGTSSHEKEQIEKGVRSLMAEYDRTLEKKFVVIDSQGKRFTKHQTAEAMIDNLKKLSQRYLGEFESVSSICRDLEQKVVEETKKNEALRQRLRGLKYKKQLTSDIDFIRQRRLKEIERLRAANYLRHSAISPQNRIWTDEQQDDTNMLPMKLSSFIVQDIDADMHFKLNSLIHRLAQHN